MKLSTITIALTLLLFSCGRSGSESSTSDTVTSVDHTAAPQSDAVADTASATDTPADDATVQKGGQLLASSDCLSCHRNNEKLVGPAYADVAKKYENTPANVELLATKIIKGGSGNWGETAMTPHPAISMDDAESIVKYIFTIK